MSSSTSALSSSTSALASDNELDILLPDHSVNLSTGETIAVTPFKFGQFPRVIKLVGRIGDQMSSLNNLEPMKIALALCEDDGEAVMNLVALVTGKSVAWCRELPGDDGLILMGKVIEVNLDFFVRRVTPAIEQFSQSLVKLSPQAQTEVAKADLDPDGVKSLQD